MGAKEVATLFVELRGNFAKFSADMNQVSKTFSGLGKSVSRVGKQLTSAFTVPLGLVGAAAIAAAKDMDEAFDTIRAKTGATGVALDGLSESFKTVFSESTQGAKEVGDTIAELNSGLGLTGKPLEDLAKQITGVAQVTGQDLGGTVKGSISLFNSWSVATDKQGQTMDFLFKVGQKTNQNVGELAATVASFQPSLKRLGLSLEEGAAMFAQLGKNGMDSGKVMAGFNMAIQKFAKAGVKDMGAALKLTFDALKKAPTDTAAATAAMEIFGKKAGPQLASLLRSGKLSVDEFLAAVGQSPETIGKAVKDTDSFSDRLVKFRHSAEVALEPLGAPILDALTEAMVAMTPIVKSLGEAFKALSPGVREFIAGAGAVLAVAGPVIKVVGFLFGWVARLGPVFTMAASGVGVLVGSLALLLTPLGLVAAAVGIAIAAWYEWDTIGPLIDEQVSLTVDAFNNIIAAIQDFAATSIDNVLAFGQGVGDGFVVMKDNVLAIVGEMVNGINEYFTGKFTAAKEAVVGFADDVLAVFQGLKADVLDNSPVPDLVNGVGEQFSTLGEKMVPPTKAAAEGVLATFDTLLAGVKAKSKDGAAAGKELADAWKKTGEDLKSVMSDMDKSVDPLRQNLTDLLKVKDFDGINKLATSFKGNKDALDQFRKSLSDSKGDFNEWQRNQTQLNSKLEETKKELFELSTGKKLIDPLTESITQLMAAGDMDGIKALGESMQDTSDDSQKFTQALGDSMGAMKEMKAAGSELTDSLTTGLSGLFENFGIGGEYADALGGILGGLSSGQGKGGMGQIGNWLNGLMGGGSIFDSILGGGAGGTGGGSGDIFGSIMSGLGLGGGASADSSIADALSGNLTDSLSLTKLAGGTSDLGSSMAGLSGGMSSMSGYLGVANDSLQSLGKIGKNTKATFEGGGQIAGAGIGAFFGGPAGAQIGSSVGKVVGSFLGDMFGGGPKNKDTLARNQVGKFLEDAFKDKHTSFMGENGKRTPFNGNFQFGSSDRFNKPGWGDAQRAKYGDQSAGVFDSIGKGLTKLLGITEDVGGQIGFILQENLSGNIDNARLLMQELGISQEEMTDAFVKAGEAGDMSWHSVEVSLQGVAAAFGEGLVAVGDMAGGFDQIVQSGGDGMDAIQGIKNAAIEAGEAGVTSFAAWKQSLLAAGSDPAYVDAFFAALQSRGITSLEQIKDSTTRVLGGVIADMQSNSTALASVWQKAQEESQKYLETVSKIPDSSIKNVELNVSANVSGDAKKVLDMQPQSSQSAGDVPKFARGGVVTGPTLGLIGEAGPEAILPLSRLGGMLKQASMQGVEGAGSNVYHIDARGASPGVESDIMRAMASIEQRAVEAAINAVADQRERGGNFSESF